MKILFARSEMLRFLPLRWLPGGLIKDSIGSWSETRDGITAVRVLQPCTDVYCWWLRWQFHWRIFR